MMLIASTSLLLLLFIHHEAHGTIATAILYQDNSNTTNGSLTFIQNTTNGSVTINGTISGLTPNSTHGFHVHTSPVAEPSPNCSAAGAHFNPYNVSHGPPSANISFRHVGDLGNLTANASGIISVNITDSIIQLFNGNQSIINRTIVLHSTFDDGGFGYTNVSNTTGNSGSRILCGLIKLSLDVSSNTSTSATNATSTAMMTTTSRMNTTSSKAGLNIKPLMSILSMTLVFSYIFVD